MSSLSTLDVLGYLDQTIKKEFDSNKRVLSYDEYLGLVSENPVQHTRGSAQYMAEMMDHYGKSPVHLPEHGGADTEASHEGIHRFHLFDQPIDGITPKLIGHEEVQTALYRSLKSFMRQGRNDKLLLLHGPNGSAKSTISHALMAALDRYSHDPAGAAYTFQWVFPVERYTKGGIGIQAYHSAPKESTLTSYAHLADDEIAARINCDLKDHPLLLIPIEHRKSFLENILGKEKADRLWEQMPNSLTQGELCHRCKEVFEAMLVAQGGNFRKVMAHIQVERLYYSRRYRFGIVTIEPQLHVDAQYNLLTYNKSLSSIPPALHGLNLFSLSGDLIEGNRGMIEFSDLLKRPVDSFKYLLGACETGAINVGHSIAQLDTVLIGSTNELQLDAFKEFPDFSSFKARIELIRVPYLLSVHQEQEIYQALLPKIGAEKHIAPHVAWTASLWAVLTRLKKPNSLNYPASISSVIANLTPLEKSRLYDRGEMPVSLSPEDRKILRASIEKLKQEYNNIPYYEGRIGASPREMKSILMDASQNVEFPCLSPLALFREMERFVKRVTEYEFLKQDIKDGYHDAIEFINVVRAEYLDKIDGEVRECIGLYDSAQWEDFLKKYVQIVSSVLKKEKIKNPITGKMEDPDRVLLDEFEKIIGAPKEDAELEAFRRNVISQVGAWSLDHRHETVVYAKVFPEFWSKLQKHYFESQKATLTQMQAALLDFGTGKEDISSEGGKLAIKTIENMKSCLSYCEGCAREVITFLMRKRY